MYRFIVIAVVAFVFWRLILRWRRGEITGRRFAAWALLWLGVLVLGLMPKVTDAVSQWAGVERGATLFMFLAILFLLYLVLLMNLRIDRQQRDLTELVRKLALRDLDLKQGDEANHQAAPIPDDMKK